MTDVVEKQQVDLFLRWNPEFVVMKDKINGSNMLCLPIQDNKLLNFKHFKGLSTFDLKLNLDQIDGCGIYKYCDGTKTVKQVCGIITSQFKEVTESAVMEKIGKLVRLGVLILHD